MTSVAEHEPVAEPGAFTIGSPMRHVLVMTATGSAGLIAVFFVDFLTLLYISRLGDTKLTAAVGFASQMMFLLISINIGLSIAIGALVSRALGAGDRPRARRLASSGAVIVALVSGAASLAAMPFTREIIALFGGRGEVLDVGALYLRMTLPASVFLGLGMAFSAMLRGVGDARRAMNATLAGAVATAILDPILIFGLHLGVYGAAISVVVSRFCVMLVGWRAAARRHRLLERPQARAVLEDIAPMAYIAGPAVLTNIATPIANIYVMHVFARFGEATVAAFAIMDRVTPVAFGVLFALSGSVGPIMGQNYGARAMDRVRMTLTDCFKVAAIYTVATTLVLWFASPLIIALFDAKGETAALLEFFCRVTGVLWLFLGGVFVSNACFNNLGWPFLAAGFNWGRATFGTVPFVTLGALWSGPKGGYLGLVLGAAVFGVLAVVAAYRVVGRVSARTAPATS